MNIYIAGHRGMVGSAIARKLKADPENKIIQRTHAELDLTNQAAVHEFIGREKPDQIYLAAAKVGGIYANNTYPADFIYQNLMIQSNIINAAYKNNIQKLLFLGSSCIYPREVKQPMREDALLTGRPDPTNEPYAIAKITGIKLCESYFRQYGDNFISVMPNNLYGPNDNYDLETSHVLPALLRKFHEGKIQNTEYVEVWGSGSPKREFLHVDDIADACVYLMNNLDAKQLYRKNISHINIGSGEEITIKELALMIKDIVGYQGDLKFNSSYPDGMPRKLLDVKRLTAIGWKSRINLDEGISSVYDWYLTAMVN